MSRINVTVIIPAYNEAENIGGVVSDIKGFYPDFEIIVIDDGSTDGTAKVAQEAGAIVFRHPYNIGNGAAIKSGIRIASGEILVLMDGDGQHVAHEINKLLEHLPHYDMVVAERPKGHHTSWVRAIGNWLYNKFASYVTKFEIRDLTSGFRAIKAEVARNFLYLLPNTYSYPTTLTLALLRSGRSLKYVPVKVETRKRGNSNIKVFRDGIRFFLIILKICALFSPLRIFLPISCGMFCLGLGYYLYTFFSWGRFTNMSALLFTSSVIIFMMGLVSEQICQMRFERSEGDNPY